MGFIQTFKEKTTPFKRTVILAFVVAFAMFLPSIIFEKGFFFFYGDFNVQQIPFYQLAHEAIRSGSIRWNEFTDLGVNFLASYSFYLLFSPFFWLTLPFPTSFVPHLMGPLLILKFTCMAATSHIFLKRFFKNENYATIGALLYAFSGFSVYNIFFNHFHEVLVFFPLLLVGVEELVTKNRRGLFAAMVFVNCIVNYWFFIGEVVFVIIYVLVRMGLPGWNMSFKRFLTLVFEAVLGLALSFVFLLPSVAAIMGNPRTGADNILTGFSLWKYFDDQIVPAVLQSIFFPPEWASRPNFLSELRVKWSSMSLWLPVFSTAGTVSYLLWAKKSWVKRIILISVFMSLLPFTNSLFVLMNNSYYARWFYMPLLIMALATARALERADIDFARGLKWTGFIILGFTLAVALTPVKNGEGGYNLGMMSDKVRFWLTVLIAVIGLALTAVLIYKVRRENKNFIPATLAVLTVFSILYGNYYIINAKMFDGNGGDFLRDKALYGRENLELPAYDGFVRSDIYKGMDNLGMYWHIPNIQAFHSIIPNSIMEFYPTVGVKRDVSSKPELRIEGLRPLLSVKWLITKEGSTPDETVMHMYEYATTTMGYDVYENKMFLPMGFGYTSAFGDDIKNLISAEYMPTYMLNHLYLADDDIWENIDLLDENEEFDYSLLDYENMEYAVEERSRYTCDSFEFTKTGFVASSSLSEPVMMFFSVPHDSGWTATVNGEDAKVYKANIGFMAVRLPEGECDIVFTYTTPLLKEGAMATGAAVIVFAVYMVYARKKVVAENTPNLTEMNDQIAAVEKQKLKAEILAETEAQNNTAAESENYNLPNADGILTEKDVDKTKPEEPQTPAQNPEKDKKED